MKTQRPCIWVCRNCRNPFIGPASGKRTDFCRNRDCQAEKRRLKMEASIQARQKREALRDARAQREQTPIGKSRKHKPTLDLEANGGNR